jgi:hypothetical protein
MERQEAVKKDKEKHMLLMSMATKTPPSHEK